MRSGEATAEEVVAGAERYAAEAAAGDGNIYGSENWLKQRKWKDKPPPRNVGAARQARGRKMSLSNIALRAGGYDIAEDWQQ